MSGILCAQALLQRKQLLLKAVQQRGRGAGIADTVRPPSFTTARGLQVVELLMNNEEGWRFCCRLKQNRVFPEEECAVNQHGSPVYGQAMSCGLSTQYSSGGPCVGTLYQIEAALSGFYTTRGRCEGIGGEDTRGESTSGLERSPRTHAELLCMPLLLACPPPLQSFQRGF